MSLTTEDLQSIKVIVDESIDSRVPPIVGRIIEEKVPPMINEALISLMEHNIMPQFERIDEHFDRLEGEVRRIGKIVDQHSLDITALCAKAA